MNNFILNGLGFVRINREIGISRCGHAAVMWSNP